jgi:hypothetical protein
LFNKRKALCSVAFILFVFIIFFWLIQNTNFKFIQMGTVNGSKRTNKADSYFDYSKT